VYSYERADMTIRILCAAALTLFGGLTTNAGAMGALADLTVYDRTEGRRLAVHWHEGRAYVAGRPGNEYQLVLRNRSGQEVLAIVSVDGVNAISGETADPAQTGYVLDKGRALEVRGWRKSLAQTAAFYFTALSDSYAARTGRSDNVGVIGVALFRRKPSEPPLSMSRAVPDTRAKEAAGASADQAETPLGTGHGRRENSPARYVAFERASSVPAETLTLFYDSYRNLAARGVIAPARIAPLPRPFPGFAPDPA
jgi:hypothetical protein